MAWTFESEIYLWHAGESWHLLNVPEDVADDIDEQVPDKRGFGSVRVKVTIGSFEWQTSVFPSKEQRTYVLPIKKAVRTAEDLAVGDRAQVTLEIAQ
ncbi:MAG: DUF1905 domain-containing protein [Candidatus Nanopelagicales bacterium]